MRRNHFHVNNDNLRMPQRRGGAEVRRRKLPLLLCSPCSSAEANSHKLVPLHPWYIYSILSDPLTDQPTDLELIERCLLHDEAAWEQIIARYKRKVFGIAYKFTGRFEEAEDLAQEVFFKVYKALHSYKKEQDFSWWLVSISRNACIDYYRSVKRERKILSGDLTD